MARSDEWCVKQYIYICKILYGLDFLYPLAVLWPKRTYQLCWADWGALMHDPVSTPDGYLFERAAIEVGGPTVWDQNKEPIRYCGAPWLVFFVEKLSSWQFTEVPKKQYGSDGWGCNTWDNIFPSLLALGTAGTASQPPSQNPQPQFLQILCTTTLSDDDDDDDDYDRGVYLDV